MTQSPTQRNLLFAAMAAVFVAAAATVGADAGWLPFSAAALMWIRWAAIAVATFYAFKKRSLTAWIIVSMLIGAEFGHDFPRWAIGHDPAVPLASATGLTELAPWRPQPPSSYSSCRLHHRTRGSGPRVSDQRCRGARVNLHRRSDW